MTFRKTILITLSQLLFVLTYGQNEIKPVVISRDTSTIVFGFHCAPTLSQKEPLLIINGDRFKSNTLQRHFFNIKDVESIHVIPSTNDSIKYFGKAGQNGVIVLTTRSLIEWITSKDIAREKVPHFLWFRKKVLFEVDGRKFDSNETLYFAKESIGNISVDNDFFEYYIDKPYRSKITISTKEKSGG